MAKEISCRAAGVDCNFLVRSDSDEELVSIVQQHAKKMHKSDISRADVLKMARKV